MSGDNAYNRGRERCPIAPFTYLLVLIAYTAFWVAWFGGTI